MSEDGPKQVDLWDIPVSWTWTKAGEIASVVGGGTPRTDDSSNFENGNVPWITPADLSGYSQKRIERGARNITDKGLAHSGATMVPPGTVLFSSRAPIGYVAIAAKPVSTNQGFKSFVPGPPITPDFLYYYLQLAKPIARELANGTTFLEISGAKAAEIPVPLAPLSEQVAIVAEIEKQFTRLDAATAALKRAQANLKRYRASVLKAACEGRLAPTEAELARNEGREFEPAGQLLQRILRERRARWEADTLAKMIASGKPPTDDRWKQKYKEPSAPDVSTLPALPEGWCWTALDQLALIQGGVTKGEKRKGGEKLRCVAYLRVANVQRGHLKLEEVKQIEATEAEIQELALRNGDVLLNEGGDRDKLGRGWVWKDQLPLCIHQNHVFRARPVFPYVDPIFLASYTNSFGQQYFFAEGKHTTNLASLSMTKLKALPVPLPPFAEQSRIVQSLSAALSDIDRPENVLPRCILKSESLRRAILQAAFSGQLVPQDPNDEPASLLLERIRAQRNSEAEHKTSRRRKEPAFA